jgi:hypothetical protein
VGETVVGGVVSVVVGVVVVDGAGFSLDAHPAVTTPITTRAAPPASAVLNRKPQREERAFTELMGGIAHYSGLQSPVLSSRGNERGWAAQPNPAKVGPGQDFFVGRDDDRVRRFVGAGLNEAT